MKDIIKEYYQKEHGLPPCFSLIICLISFSIGVMCVCLPISANETDKPFICFVMVFEIIGFIVFLTIAFLHKENKSIVRNLLSAMCWFAVTLAVYYICSYAVRINSVLKISVFVIGAVLSAIILIGMMIRKEKHLMTQEDYKTNKSASVPITLAALFAFGFFRLTYKIFPQIMIIYVLLGDVTFGWLCAYYSWFSAKQIKMTKKKQETK